MTKEQAAAAAAVMLAFSKGKQIQSKWKLDSIWEDNPDPIWDWRYAEYRIKPKIVKYRTGLFGAEMQHETHWVNSYIDTNTAYAAERSLFFVRWLTDWIEVEA